MKSAMGTKNHGLEGINYSSRPACMAGFFIVFVIIIVDIILLSIPTTIFGGQSE
jgi:hypothetical protein